MGAAPAARPAGRFGYRRLDWNRRCPARRRRVEHGRVDGHGRREHRRRWWARDRQRWRERRRLGRIGRQHGLRRRRGAVSGGACAPLATASRSSGTGTVRLISSPAPPRAPRLRLPERLPSRRREDDHLHLSDRRYPRNNLRRDSGSQGRRRNVSVPEHDVPAWLHEPHQR